MNYYYAQGDQQKGPVNKVAFQSLVETGTIQPETLVWKEGLADWMPFSQVDGHFLGEGAVLASASSIQQIKEGVTEDVGFEIASNWRKFFSYILDGILLSIVTTALGLPLGINPFDPASQLAVDPNVLLIKSLADFVLGVIYYVAFLGVTGSTLAMKILGLHIVRTDGSKVGVLRVLGRYFASILSSLILFIGFIMAFFDDQKRTLHDRICDTLIIRK